MKEATPQILRLSNGIRLITQPCPGLRSVALGLWAVAGSRYESGAESGAAHFLEHMFFKGTSRRTAYQIAFETNTLGSHVNAFTTQEVICVYARVIGEKLGHVADLLCDMLGNSLMAPDELERERNVILDEVMMYEDTPDERVADLFTETLWGGHPLGRPVLGNAAALRAMTPDTLRAYQTRWFRPERMLVSVAGSVDAEQAARAIEDFGFRISDSGDQRTGLVLRREPEGPSAGLQSAIPPGASRDNPQSAIPLGASRNNPQFDDPQSDTPAPIYASRYIEKPLEQAHLCVGVVGPRRHSPDRYAVAALNLILGGGMASRLFQEVREKRGLAYSIGSYATAFLDTGCLAIYGAAAPGVMEELLDICWRETRRVCDEVVTGEELQNAKDMMRASLVLSLEGASACMTRLAEHLIYHGRPIPIEETLGEIDRLTAKDLRACAERYLKDQPVASAFIGPPEAKAATQGRDRF